MIHRLQLITLLPLALVGCAGYVPQQLADSSTVDLCEWQTQSTGRFSDDSRRRVQSELERRKANCREERAALQARRDEELYDRMYRNQSP